MHMDRELKRISLMIADDQYKVLSERGLNLSWLVRDLLDDYLKENRITFHVHKETQALYEKIGGLTTMNDNAFEPFLRDALKEYLKHQIEKMQNLDHQLSQKKKE